MNRHRLTMALSALAVTVGTVGAAVLTGTSAASAKPSPVTSVPVLDWHELDNGCAPTTTVCNAPDPESVSTAQLTAELGYLKSQGYHTITPARYLAWKRNADTSLPSKPILLIADNGIENLLAGVEPVLTHDHFTMAVAVVSGFADGASGICPEPVYQPGCGVDNEWWDATWSQLAALPKSVYNFILEAGPAGHFVQNYDPACTAFYACKVAGETDAAYEQRVAADLQTGVTAIESKLGAGRFTAGLWVVPYSDAGYPQCTDVSCTPQPYDGPAGWLTSFAASNFSAVFVEDAVRNGQANERFRIDVQGWMTETEFEAMFNADLAAGDFSGGGFSGPSGP